MAACSVCTATMSAVAAVRIQLFEAACLSAAGCFEEMRECKVCCIFKDAAAVLSV